MTVQSERTAGDTRQLLQHAQDLLDAGCEPILVGDIVRVSFESDGVFGLLQLWANEPDPTERAEILRELRLGVEDWDSPLPVVVGKLEDMDLDWIADNTMLFKDQLRILVDQRGGLTELALRVGMSQPSLSRFFASDSVPRRATLLRIAAALGLGSFPLARHEAFVGRVTRQSGAHEVQTLDRVTVVDSRTEETIAVHRIHSELRSRRVSPAEGTGRRLGRAKFPTLH